MTEFLDPEAVAMIKHRLFESPDDFDNHNETVKSLIFTLECWKLAALKAQPISNKVMFHLRAAVSKLSGGEITI